VVVGGGMMFISCEWLSGKRRREGGDGAGRGLGEVAGMGGGSGMMGVLERFWGWGGWGYRRGIER